MRVSGLRSLRPALLFLLAAAIAAPFLLTGDGPERLDDEGGGAPPVRREHSLDELVPDAAPAGETGGRSGPGAAEAAARAGGRPATISGRIRGEPVPLGAGAWISVTGARKELRAPVEADGSFLFPEVPSGLPLDLWLGPDPSGSRVSRVAARLLLEPGELREISLVAETVAAVRGRVTDEAGRPLEGVRVAVLPPEADWRTAVPVAATTDPEGGFFVGLSRGVEPARMRLVVDAVERGFVLEERLVGAEALAAGAAAEIRLRFGREIGGRVVGPGGRPVPGAVVHLLEEYRGDPDLRRPVEGRVTTDEDGRFHDDAYREGVYRLILGGRFEGRRIFAVVPAVTAGDTDVEVRVDGFGALVARFEDAETRAPVEASEVSAEIVWNHTGEAEDWGVWAEGRGEVVAFEDLPAGHYRLRVAAPGYVPLLTPLLFVRAGDRLGPLRFELTPRR